MTFLSPRTISLRRRGSLPNLLDIVDTFHCQDEALLVLCCVSISIKASQRVGNFSFIILGVFRCVGKFAKTDIWNVIILQVMICFGVECGV